MVHTLGSMRSIVAENRELQQIVAELRGKQVSFDQLQLENELLKKELDYNNFNETCGSGQHETIKNN